MNEYQEMCDEEIKKQLTKANKIVGCFDKTIWINNTEQRQRRRKISNYHANIFITAKQFGISSCYKNIFIEFILKVLEG